MVAAGYAVSFEDVVSSHAVLSPGTLEDFAHPGETTRVLLTLNGELVREYESGENHAEYEMLQSDAWAKALTDAGRAAAGTRVAVLVNRTPCHFVFGDTPWMEGAPSEVFAARIAGLEDGGGSFARPWRGCSLQLAAALKGFWRAYPGARSAVEFVLACRGYYTGRQFVPMAHRRHQAATTTFDLGCLVDAGWQLRALAIDKTLSERGEALANVLPHVETWVRGGR